jgi:predicted metal-dependent HD superfamily phosphohydrolase
LARAFLHKAGAEPALTDLVARLILVTKTHEPEAAGVPDGGLMVDVDLAILGQPRAEFQAYDRAIREEYAWVPTEIYEEKRREVLQRFLLRPRLYQTDFFFGKYEAQARANLAWRLDPTHSPL